MRRAIASLLERLDRPLSLEDLAHEVGYSKFHLCRMFTVYLGCSAGKLHTELRLTCAEAMLRAGVKPAHVAAELGFSDQAYFTRFFRAKRGVSPGKFARQTGSGPDGRAGALPEAGDDSNDVQDAMSNCITVDSVSLLPARA